MSQFLLCTLLIAQCVIASDDEQRYTPVPTDEGLEETVANLSDEELINAIHRRTENAKCCCPLYDTERTRQLFAETPRGLPWNAPIVSHCLSKCYVPMREKGCGCEHAYCCAGMSEGVATIGCTTYAIFFPGCSTITNATCCAISSLMLLWNAKNGKKLTKILDTQFSDPNSWPVQEIPRVPVMRESDDDE